MNHQFVPDLRPIRAPTNIPDDIHKLTSFVTFYAPGSSVPKYISKSPIIRVSLNDVYAYDPILFQTVIRNLPTYHSMLCSIFDRIFYDNSDDVYDSLNPSPASLLMYQRLARLKEKFPDKRVTDVFPGDLIRDYELNFVLDESYVKQILDYINNNEISNINNNIISNLSNNDVYYLNNNSSHLNNNEVYGLNNEIYNSFSYNYQFINLIPFLSIRQLQSHNLGKYLCTRGVVTRISPVTPLLTLATYICETCGSETYQPVNPSFNLNTNITDTNLLVYDNIHTISNTPHSTNKNVFKVLTKCDSPRCRVLLNPPTLTMQPRTSKFTVCQMVCISEPSKDVPGSCTPLSLSVVMRGHGLVERVRVGDSVVISGVYVVMGVVGGFECHEVYDEKGTLHNPNNNNNSSNKIIDNVDFNNKKTDNNNIDNNQINNYQMNNIDLLNTTDNNITNNINCNNNITDNTNINKIDVNISNLTNKSVNMLDSNTNYNKINVNMLDSFPSVLVDSFAPEIYNYTDIKKILILALTGSYLKEESEMKIRGNINVLLVGDPGTSKSQLLKTVNKIAPRGVYVTGKGTTGVGMTASLSREPIGINNNGEYILEAGALVLSDGGVCCIDEIDKMNDNDRVAIHEVMEQQSISISKAGINTTLNARCSIIAAANPINRSKGKKESGYDNKKSIEWNVGMGVALVSRFDCIVVMNDIVDMEKDKELAKHITEGFKQETNNLYNTNNNNKNAVNNTYTNNNFDSTNNLCVANNNFDSTNNLCVGNTNRNVFNNNTYTNNNFDSTNNLCVGNTNRNIVNNNTFTNNNFDSTNNITTNTYTNNNMNNNELNKKLMSYEEIRAYIEKAQKLKPTLDQNLGKKLIEAYIEKRKENEKITPRYLLSLIRFTIAHARLRMSTKVESIDIEESIRLLNTGKIGFENINNNKYSEKENKIREIFGIIGRIENEFDGTIEYKKIIDICKNYGFEQKEVEKTLEMYVDSGAVIIEGEKIKILK